jgi:putative ABC transport system substrate-binding protein
MHCSGTPVVYLCAADAAGDQLQMRRRDFLVLVGGAAMPLRARAEQAARPVIGYLGSETPDLFANRLHAFREGLRESGHVEGRDAEIAFRWAQGRNDRFPALAADLVRLQVAVIAAPGSTPAALAAKAATATIPIVFAVGADPVQLGLVSSLSRPGGNVTGATSLNTEIGPKRLQLALELVPSTKIIGLLVNPTNPALAAAQASDAQAAARNLGLQVRVLHASGEPDFDPAFASMGSLGAGALVIGNDAFFISQTQRLAALAVRYAVPTIHQSREFAIAGGLISYGGSLLEAHRQAGVYVSRILDGARAADLPIAQSTKVEMVINVMASKALGLTIPPTLLARADEVIE